MKFAVLDENKVVVNILRYPNNHAVMTLEDDRACNIHSKFDGENFVQDEASRELAKKKNEAMRALREPTTKAALIAAVDNLKASLAE